MGKFYEAIGDELILFTRQWAWLTAVPKEKRPDGTEVRHRPRIDVYKAASAEPPLPEITARHIFDWFMEVGPAETGGMGPAPLSWREIAAWSEKTFTPISAWEARLLSRMSKEHLAESHLAEAMNRPAPWSARPTAVDHAANERQLRAVLG